MLKSFIMGLKKIALWLLTVFYVSGAIIYIPAAGGFLAIVVAALLLPVQRWQDMISRVVNGKLKTILIIVLAILAIAMMPAEPVKEGTTGEMNAASSTVLSNADTATTSEPVITQQVAFTDAPTTAVPTERATTTPTSKPTVTPTVKPTSTPTVTPTKDPNRDYVVNTGTGKFHYPSCSSVDKIKESNKQEFHGTREKLINKGYTPCGVCHP